jgi:hypothetical protein
MESNEFSNQWATLSWTDLGGEYVIFEGNNIIGASSWRQHLLPVRYLYAAFNRSSNLVPGEREALTFDVNEVLPSKRHPRLGDQDTPPVEAWQGYVTSATPNGVRLKGASLIPHAYRGLDILILSGRGAGQIRQITDNGTDAIAVARTWEVLPDQSTLILAFQLSGDCILYRNRGVDTSVLLQIWGYLCNVTFDSNDTERTQGMWALSGWFIQWLNNRLYAAATFHSGVGPLGVTKDATPEATVSYGLMGFTIAGIMQNFPIPFPYVRACVIRNNSLDYGFRIVLMLGYGRPAHAPVPLVVEDVLIDRNKESHAEIGIELDAGVEDALVYANSFDGVRKPVSFANPSRVVVVNGQ